MTYSVYGIRLVSSEPIPELQAAATSTAAAPQLLLRVNWPAAPAPPLPDSWFREWDQNGASWLRFARLAAGDGYLLHFSGRATFRVSRSGDSIDCWGAPDVPSFSVRHLLLDQVLPLAVNRLGIPVFHGSAVMFEGHGSAVFAGPSGRGKSTLAGFLAQRRCRLVSDDCVALLLDGLRVAPGYPGVRLWRDSLSYLDARGRHHAPPVTHDKDKRRYASPGALAFAAELSELRRFYFLAPAEESSRIHISKATGANLLKEIVTSQFLLDSEDPEEIQRNFTVARQLAATGLCYRLAIPRDLKLLPGCAGAIARHVSGLISQEVFTMQIDEAKSWVAAEGLSSSEIEGEAVVLNLADGNFYGLNELAARVWREMSQPRTVSELAGMLTTEYEVDEETARRDVTQLLSDLHERKLVEEAAA